MKTSIIFSESGTIVGHKVANSWKLLTYALRSFPFTVKIWHHSGPQGWEKEFHQDRASSIKVPVANFTFQSSVQLLRGNTDSVRSNQRISPTAPSEPLKLKGWQRMNSL
ncbi:hypothetical protein Tco_0259392 [Tanacetum coccineum]